MRRIAHAVYFLLKGAVRPRECSDFFALLERYAENQALVRMKRWPEMRPAVDHEALPDLTKRNGEQDRQSLSRLRRCGLIGAPGRELVFPDLDTIEGDELRAYLERFRYWARIPRTVLRYIASHKVTQGQLCAVLALAAHQVEGLKARGNGRRGGLSEAAYGVRIGCGRKSLARGLDEWEARGWITQTARGFSCTRVWAADPDWMQPKAASGGRPVESCIRNGPMHARPTKAARVPVSGMALQPASACIRNGPALEKVLQRSPSENDSEPITALRASGTAPAARAVMKAEGASGAVHEARAARGIELNGVKREWLDDGATLMRIARRFERERRWTSYIARNFVFGAAEHAKTRGPGNAAGNFANAIRTGVARITAADERNASSAIARFDAAQPRHNLIAELAASLSCTDAPRKADEHARWLSVREQLNADRELTGFAATNESGEDEWGASGARTATLDDPRENKELPAAAADSTRNGEDDDSHEAPALPNRAIPRDDAPKSPRRLKRVAAARDPIPFWSTLFPAGVPVLVPAPYIEPRGGTFTPLQPMTPAEFYAMFGISADGSASAFPELRAATAATLAAYGNPDLATGL